MKKVWRWLARMWSAIRHKRILVVDIEARDENDVVYTYADLMVAARRHASRFGEGATNGVLHQFGATLTHLGRVREEDIGQCLYAIQHTVIADSFVAHAKTTRKVDGRHYGPRCLYAIVMDGLDEQDLFESKTVQAKLIALGYAPMSHGPVLSDLTQLGYLESVGEGWYGVINMPGPRVDWTEEGYRLKAMRAARRVS